MNVPRHPAAFESPLVVVSNRGPVSFSVDEGGELSAVRGSGGLVTALAGALFESDATWLAAAGTDGDRAVAASGRPIDLAPAGRASFIDVPEERYLGYYNGVSNRILWLLHHYLFDLSYLPTWNAETRAIWDDYREVNRQFAQALDRESDRQPVYLIQDYHLSLVPRFLRELQPDALITHFTHTPFAGPAYLKVLPAPLLEELLRGMLGADVLGFQAEAWAENFLLSVRDSLSDARVDLRRRRVHVDGRTVLVRTYPVSLDPGPLRLTSRDPEVKRIRRELTRWRGEAKLLLRVDRFELSKNIPRGYMAFDSFLADHPEWHGRVRFLSLLPRSRAEIPEYETYAARSLEAADAINAKYGPDWIPIEIRTEENYHQAVAAYGMYDALIVNPIFDGMNLVAMEGPLVNKRHGAVILSHNAGAYARLGRHAIGVNPFDVAETAAAIHQALEMPDDERIRRARGLTRAVLTSSPVRWLTAQLRDLDRARAPEEPGGSEPGEHVEEPFGTVDGEVGHGHEIGGSF